MKIDIYCDETLPDLFTSSNQSDKNLLIGSLWIESELREDIKQKIKDLRSKHNVWGEIKWSKVSKSKESFYLELVDLFFSYKDRVRFRCIAVNPNEIIWAYHNDDKELGFYKFYYFVLDKWIRDFNEYSIFCDAKVNRDLSRLNKLHEILITSNRLSYIDRVQALPSKEVVLIQLTDLLLGAASSKLNSIKHTNMAKNNIIDKIEQNLGRKIKPTYLDEKKFNLFNIKLKGGW